MGIMLARVKCVFRTIRVDMMNSDNIIPSRHSSEDIKGDRYISNPARAIVNAIMMFMYTNGT